MKSKKEKPKKKKGGLFTEALQENRRIIPDDSIYDDPLPEDIPLGSIIIEVKFRKNGSSR